MDNQASRGRRVFCAVTWRLLARRGGPRLKEGEFDARGGVGVVGEELTHSNALSIILLILHEPYCDGNVAALASV